MKKTYKTLLAVLALTSAANLLAGTFKPNEDFEDQIATVTVKQGEAHTFIISGIDAENTAIDGVYVEGVWTYKEDGETCEDSIDASDFYEEEIDGKLTWYIAVAAEDWEYAYNPPSSVKFRVVLTGWPYDKDDDPQPDRNYSFSHQDGYAIPVEPEPAIPVGSADNPAKLSASGTLASPVSVSYTPPEYGEYHFQVTLTAGRKYYFGILDAENSTNSISIAYSQTGDNLFLDEKIARSYIGEAEWKDCAEAYAFVPPISQTYSLTATSPGGTFTLKTALLPSLSPADHKSTELVVGQPVVFNPGHLNNPTNGNYDSVIDECLFSFVPEADSSYVFETSGADTNLMMRLYKKDVTDGSFIVENSFVETYDNNCRIVWTAPSKTALAGFSPVYVGVCQRFAHTRLIDEEMEVVSAGKVSLTVNKVEPVDEVLPLIAVPAADADESPVFAAGAIPLTNRVLSATSWKHTYAIAARKDVTYQIKTVIPENDETGLMLGARAYTLNAQGKETPIDTYGSLDPHYDEGSLSFTLSANQLVYLEVYVDEGDWGSGIGLDFPAYDIYAAGWKPETQLSLLKVTLMGAPEKEMKWQIGTETAVQYPSGTAVLLPEGTYDILPKEIKNYAKPAKHAVDAVVGSPVEHIYKYTDTADPLDNQPSGQYGDDKTKKYSAVKLTPSAKPVSVSRSLWGDEDNYDPADWFTFTGAEGVHYRFDIKDVQGAPKVTVYDWTLTNVIANFFEDSTDVYQFSVGSSGNRKAYYVKVSHADELNPVDSAYTLEAKSINVGAVKFAKTAVSAKEDAAYVDLAVKRTAKEGRIRIRYRTREGMAKPGERYYPANGELVWEDGDNKDKTIRVRLIPDEKPTYIDGKPVTFDVLLETLDTAELEEGEYLPAFSGADTATVSITETAKKTPGSVSLEYSVNGGAYVPFTNPKKPAVEISRMDRLSIRIVREAGDSGANGSVGVEVATKAGTANKAGDNTDFTTPEKKNIVWKDGDTSAHFFDVETLANGDDHSASKAFTVTLKALSTDPADSKAKLERLTLAAQSVTVTIKNGKTGTITDLAKAYSKELKAEGVAIKETKAGQWIVETGTGAIVADIPQTGTKPVSSDLSFTLTGPGRFTAKPIVPDGCEMKCSNGKVSTVICTNEVDMVLYVPSGSQTVKFTTVNSGCGLKPFADGLAYRWEPLSDVTPAAPTVDKAVVAPGAVELCFKREDGVSYRVYALSSGAKSSANKAMKLGDPETEIASVDGAFLIDAKYNTVNKGKYTWKVDSYFEGGSVTNVSKKTFNLAVANVPEGKELPLTAVVGNGVWGDEINAVGGTNIVLKQGVKASFAVGAPTSTVKSVAGKLPDGLKLEVDKVTKQTYLRGTPTKAGAFQALLQETGANKVAGATTVLDITVDAVKSASVGSFYGLVTSGSPTNGAARAATVTITATAAGKLSAKVALAGKTYSFTDTGYSYIGGERDGEEPLILHAKLAQIQKVGKDSYTNYLHYAVYDLDEVDPESWTREGMVYLEMNCLPDAKGSGFQEGIVFEDGHLFRDNAKVAAWQADAAKFAGYYTTAIVPSSGLGEPMGNGYLTLTIDAKGKVKMAGLLADNVKLSASSTAYLNQDGLNVPIYYCKGTELFAGWINLSENNSGEIVIVKDACAMPLRWYNDDVNSTEWGDAGFAIDVEIVGGWYNTVYNLQRHYLDYAFMIDMPYVDELPSELLPEGYNFVAGIGPVGMEVDVAGNTLSLDKQSLVKMVDPATGRKTTLNDLGESVNPQNVQLKFTRATGLVSGSFILWYEGYNARNVFEQKSLSKVSHQGIMVLSRAEGSVLSDDVLTAGFFTLDVTKKIDGINKTRKWKASYPFNISLVNIGYDFTE